MMENKGHDSFLPWQTRPIVIEHLFSPRLIRVVVIVGRCGYCYGVGQQRRFPTMVMPYPPLYFISHRQPRLGVPSCCRAFNHPHSASTVPDNSSSTAPTQVRTTAVIMAPITQASDENTHQALLDQLDIYGLPKPFRNPHWKPPQRRNKNLKQIVADASRKEASQMATQNNSGASTPALPHTIGSSTPIGSDNIAQAAQNLHALVLEKNMRTAAALNGGPAITFTNIESAPSLHPSSQRRYCDVTGLPAPYTDPKTRLRYHNGEVFGLIRTMGQTATEGYLAARGAHTVLK